MPQNKTNWIRRFPKPKAALLALLFLYGNTVLAQASSPSAPGEKVTVGEILMYIALIVGVILVAWFLVGRTGGSGPEASSHPHTPRKHYDHPNDPHFRKLKKKTS